MESLQCYSSILWCLTAQFSSSHAKNAANTQHSAVELLSQCNRTTLTLTPCSLALGLIVLVHTSVIAVFIFPKCTKVENAPGFPSNGQVKESLVCDI